MKNRSLYKNHDGKKHDNNLCKIAVPPDNSHIPLRKDMCSLQADSDFEICAVRMNTTRLSYIHSNQCHPGNKQH